MKESNSEQVERVMTQAERDLFLARVTLCDSKLRGAKVSDVLDLLAEHDSDIEIVDRIFGKLEKRYSGPIVEATLAVLYTHGEPGFSEVKVRELLDRLGPGGRP